MAVALPQSDVELFNHWTVEMWDLSNNFLFTEDDI